MASIKGMETYAARLASFNVAHPATKKRVSNNGASKILKWPHRTPAPAQLARAGFFYRPTTSCPDNTSCFLCQKDLDGWETDDNAITEHLRLSPDCGWAITVCIEQNIEDEVRDGDDPMSAKMLEARRATFGAAWPHEGKRGWTCKTQKMIEAGWYYSPTAESDDFVKCPYCSLSLDGWEPKDNPFNEHQRRSPDCLFFNPTVSNKSGRPKKGRGSKASRISTQSNFSAIPESSSMTDIVGDKIDIAPPSAIVDVPTDTKVAKVERKVGRPKKGLAKLKAKSAKEREEDSVQASSFVEPEDDDFEVKIASTPAPAMIPHDRKRKSDELAEAGAASPTHIYESAPKRRNTRTKGSAMSQATTMPTPPTELDSDTQMTDAEIMPPPKAPVSKKRGKIGNQRSSSAMRHASNISTASTASLRAAVPNDEQIEAALEAELDRPLTDNEMDIQPGEERLPKTQRLTRMRPGSRKVTASVAPVRRTTRTSVMTIDNSQENERLAPKVHVDEEHFALSTASMIPGDVNQTKEVPIKSLPGMENKAALSNEALHNASATESEQLRIQSTKQKVEPEVMENASDQHDAAGPITKGSRSRQPSRQMPERATRGSVQPKLNTDDAAGNDVNSSMLSLLSTKDDSGHDTDASTASRSTVKRASKKQVTGNKRGKAGKKDMMSRNIEDIVQIHVAKEVVMISEEVVKDTSNTKRKDNAIASEAPKAMILDQDTHSTQEILEPPKKAAKSTRSKGGKPKAKPKVASSPPGIQQNSAHPTALPSETRNKPQPPVSSQRNYPASGPSPAVQTTAHSTPPKAPSPQSSDAENHPPSSRPSAKRPPLKLLSPSHSSTPIRIPLATTPNNSPSKCDITKLQTKLPWANVDIENMFGGLTAIAGESVKTENIGDLSQEEKKMTVEQWIRWNAQAAEERLRAECETLVGAFEREGGRAMRCLEGVRCVD